MPRNETAWTDTKLIASIRYGLAWLRHTGMMLCLLGLAAAGMYYLWSDALQNEAYRIRAGRLLNGEEVAARGADVTEELARLNEKIAGRSIFEPGVLQDLRQAYDASPWVMKTFAFRRELPRAIRVEYQLREPAAQAYCNGYYREVDSEGVLLPRKPAKNPDGNLPIISGSLADPPQQGEKWQNQGLLDALGVIAAIKQSPLADKLRIRQAVVRRGSFFDRQLYRRNTRPRIELYTFSGARIRWGTFNRENNPDDLPSAEKIEMLERVLKSAGKLQNGLTLDIRTRSISCSGGSAMR